MRFKPATLIILFLVPVFLSVDTYPVEDPETSETLESTGTTESEEMVFLSDDGVEVENSATNLLAHSGDVEKNEAESDTQECLLGVTLNSTSCLPKEEENDVCTDEVLRRCTCPIHTVCRQAVSEREQNTESDDVKNVACSFMCVPDGKNAKMFNWQMLRHV